MNQLHFPILSFITFWPLLGVFILLFINRKNEAAIRIVTFVFMLVNFLVSTLLYFHFDPTTWQPQFVDKIPWISSLGINYYLGIDGLSLFLVLLTTFLSVVGQLSTWSAIKDKVKEFNIIFLLLLTGMLGVFESLDAFLFYVFWEFELIPMYLMIGIWGGPHRVFATMKFFLYTFTGSVFMLVAIMATYFLFHHYTGIYTFDMFQLASHPLPYNLQFWLFLAFFIAFAIKVPMFPFHTWLPWAHVEAPTVGSVILAGVLLKMGTYGFLRFNLPMFPNMVHTLGIVVIVLAIIAIFYGAMVAMVQPDWKKLVAYSSVSHLGYAMIGMFALNSQGMEGSIMEMVNHGISTGALFLMVGILYERRHTRLFSEYGGIAAIMPRFAVLAGIITLSSLGLPGTNGFISEILCLIGAFKANIWYGILAAGGAVVSAIYLLMMFQKVFYVKTRNVKNLGLKDLDLRETFYMGICVVVILWIGIYPNPLLSRMHVSVEHLLQHVNSHSEQITIKDVDKNLACGKLVKINAISRGGL